MQLLKLNCRVIVTLYKQKAKTLLLFVAYHSNYPFSRARACSPGLLRSRPPIGSRLRLPAGPAQGTDCTLFSSIVLGLEILFPSCHMFLALRPNRDLPHIFRRCLPHASGQRSHLLAPCANRCFAHLLSTGAVAVVMAFSRHLTTAALPPQEFPASASSSHTFKGITPPL